MAKNREDQAIKRRTVLYTNNNGLIQFTGWALVETSLGTMAEPFMVNQRAYVDSSIQADYDPSDPMSRVDELLCVSPDIERSIFGAERVTGGYYLPRTTIRTGNFI